MMTVMARVSMESNHHVGDNVSEGGGLEAKAVQVMMAMVVVVRCRSSRQRTAPPRRKVFQTHRYHD